MVLFFDTFGSPQPQITTNYRKTGTGRTTTRSSPPPQFGQLTPKPVQEFRDLGALRDLHFLRATHRFGACPVRPC